MRVLLAALLLSCRASAVADGSTPPPPMTGSAEAVAATSRSSAPGAGPAPTTAVGASAASDPPPSIDRGAIIAAHARHAPRRWGTSVEGVATRLAGDAPRMALTFDACGGPGGDGYDHELVELLRREAVPATLFVTARWIASHRSEASSLASDPLFELANHGSRHKPCSVAGRVAFGIPGTRSAAEAAAEILDGLDAIVALGAPSPRFYRSGTAHFDDVCASLARELGTTPVGFSISGDAGGGFTRAQIRRAIETAPDGAIVLLHMNHPTRSTAEGLADALPALRARGVELVRLGDVELR